MCENEFNICRDVSNRNQKNHVLPPQQTFALCDNKITNLYKEYPRFRVTELDWADHIKPSEADTANNNKAPTSLVDYNIKNRDLKLGVDTTALQKKTYSSTPLVHDFAGLALSGCVCHFG